jgi:hypothetical protein
MYKGLHKVVISKGTGARRKEAEYKVYGSKDNIEFLKSKALNRHKIDLIDRDGWEVVSCNRVLEPIHIKIKEEGEIYFDRAQKHWRAKQGEDSVRIRAPYTKGHVVQGGKGIYEKYNGAKVISIYPQAGEWVVEF